MGGHVSSGIQKPSVSTAEPEDRKSVSLLGGAGAFKREEARLLSALFRRFNMQGTRGAGLHLTELRLSDPNPVVRKCRGPLSLTTLAAESKSFYSTLYRPKGSDEKN